MVLRINVFDAGIRLVHDREVQLYDGKRLLRHDKYEEFIKQGVSDDELASRGIFRIHPSFRVIALAEPPKSTYVYVYMHAVWLYSSMFPFLNDCMLLIL